MNFNLYQQINQTHGHIFRRSVNSTNHVKVELAVKDYHLPLILYQKSESICSDLGWNLSTTSIESFNRVLTIL